MTKRRVYNTTSRKIQANQTKARVLFSAKKLFDAKGFDSVTIDEIAQEAGVSSPTVYSLFQSKRGVLRAVMDDSLEKNQFEDLVQKVIAEKTLKGRLKISAQISRKLYDAEKNQMNALRGVFMLAPEFKELEREQEERRYIRQEKTFIEVANEKTLVTGLSVSKARDILWAFTGRDMYRMLVLEKKWTSDEYEKWLAETLIQLLAK